MSLIIENKMGNLVAKAVNPKSYTKQEVEAAMTAASSGVKLATGITINAAWWVCLDALDKIKTHPNYKQLTKKLFQQAVQTYKKFESDLQSEYGIRLFCVSDMPEAIRARYHEGLSSQEYFEVWQSLGAMAYQKKRGYITVLANKYKISLDKHGVPHADILQWALVAQACLELARETCEEAMRASARTVTLPGNLTRYFFKKLNISEVSKAWLKAVKQLEPACFYKEERIDDRNIELGIEQLKEAWLDPSNQFDAAINSATEYSEIFHDKKTVKDAIKMYKEYKRTAVKLAKDDKI